MSRVTFAAFVLGVSCVASSVRAAELPPQMNVPYGDHPRQTLDFYPAKSDRPTPVVIFIHSGGWRAGDKSAVGTRGYLERGVSLVSIEFRSVPDGVEDKVEPPVKAPLADAARALQFVRSKAGEWNLDKKKIAATGNASGGLMALWLALHDDMADPASADPVARESTRLFCAAVNAAHVTLDPQQVREWIPNYGFGAHAFGRETFQELLDDREKLLPWIREFSPIEHVTKDDPPIALFYSTPIVGDQPLRPETSPVQGDKLAERLTAAGVDVVLVYGSKRHPQYKISTGYLVDRLTK